MLRTISIILLLIKISFLPILLHSQTQVNRTETFSFDNEKYFFSIDNTGIIAHIEVENEISNNTDLFSAGFYLVGKIDSEYLFAAQASSQLIKTMLPGPTESILETAWNNKIYSIYSDDKPFGDSWQEWKYAVELGAQYYDGDKNGTYNPIDKNLNGLWDSNEDRPNNYGDIFSWCVYNDGQKSESRRFQDSFPMGIEIRQSLFIYNKNSQHQLEDVIFVKYELTNKGLYSDHIDSVYFCVWSDPDAGIEYSDDLLGTIPEGNMAYVYDNQDKENLQLYNSLAIKILATPIYQIPGVTYIDANNNNFYDSSDVPITQATKNNGYLGTYNMPAYANVNVSSITSVIFEYMHDGFYSASDFFEKFSKGYNIYTPLNTCNPSYSRFAGSINCDTLDYRFWWTGDPINNTGWLNNFSTDQYVYSTIGPFQLDKNEPSEIWVAYIHSYDTSQATSLKSLFYKSLLVQSFFNENFLIDIPPPTNEPIIDYDFVLYQNYPNPFNSETIIKYNLPDAAHTTMKVYNILGELEALVINEYKEPGVYTVKFNSSKLSSGVYTYQLKQRGHVKSKKMLILK